MRSPLLKTYRTASQRRVFDALTVALWLLFGSAVYAQVAYDIIPLADEAKVNREPVISELGLVAWYSHGEGLVEDGGGSEIHFYNGSVTGSVTRGHYVFASNTRPQVYEDRIIWQTTRSHTNNIYGLTWTLKEVPDDKRDIPYKEQPAFFRSQLPQNEGDGQNLHLTPELQVHSGPYSNAEYFVQSRTPNVYAPIIPSNKFDAAIADDEPLTYAAEPAIGYIPSTNQPVNLNNLARRAATGMNEIFEWSEIDGIRPITYDGRNDINPAFWDRLYTWQKAKAFPFGWEIMALDDETRYQITTNFYYDMAPKANGRDIVWYGWDGNDYEIYLWNADTLETTQVTSNSFDDVSPQIWDGVITWEGYPAPEADIFIWRDGVTQQLSNNIEDDINPVIWDGKVVWQGFDGDDFEIWYFDGEKSTKITKNTYDDINPDLRDNSIVWMGYHENWDAEIFVSEGGVGAPQQLTSNEIEDKDPRTAGGKIVWQTDDTDKSQIYLATPQ